MLAIATRRLRYLGQMVALFAIYVATAKMGLRFDALAGVATTVWPPTGVAIAALFLGGRALWPAVFLAAFTVNASTGVPIWATLIIATGNTLESVVAAEMLRRWSWRRAMTRVYDVLPLGVTALSATAISATLGTAAVWLARIPLKDGYALFWMVWWVGDVLGALLIAPLIFAWWNHGRPSRNLGRWIEAAILGAALVVVSAAIFYDPFPQKVVRLARGTYSIWPVLIWAVVRFRVRGVTAALLIVSAIAISGTASGHGLFAGAINPTSPHERLFRVQCFMAVTAVSMLTLAAALAERRQAILARDEFISIASHELKTPLTALRLRLGTALRALGPGNAPQLGSHVASGGGTPDKATRAVMGAQATTDRLGRLVDDLLDVSRLTAHRLELNLEETDVRALQAELAARLREQALEAGSTITIEAGQGQGQEPIVAFCDRGRIEQVLTNLISNAIKYGAGNEITLAAHASGQRILVSVRDRGIGIAKADQERIFQAFERVESGHRVGGLGLGLYIGRQIVAAHGGSLRVSSEPGRGSTFVLELPRTANPPPQRPTRDS